MQLISASGARDLTNAGDPHNTVPDFEMAVRLALPLQEFLNVQWHTDDFVGMGMGEVSLTSYNRCIPEVSLCMEFFGCTQLLLCLMTGSHMTESHTAEQWCLSAGPTPVGAGAPGQSWHWAANCPLPLLSMPVSAPAECAQVSADKQPHPQPWHGEGEAAG